MIRAIGIIKETKNEWERRVPLIPSDVAALLSDLNIRFCVQPSPKRIFTDEQYREAGATLENDLSQSELILGIKEIKPKDLLPGKKYMFFSHTIKGQSYNMPMLRKLIELKCTLLDYERIVNEKGMRLIFFSYHAGVAGIIDTMWTYAQYLEWAGVHSPFSRLKQTVSYVGIDEAEQTFQSIGDKIKKEGLPDELCPLVIGITGYGNVARGVHHLLDFLPVSELKPEELEPFIHRGSYDKNKIYKVIFKEEDMVVPVSENHGFDLQHYYKNPSQYKTRFNQYLPYLRILVNASYWDKSYPRHVTRESVRVLFRDDPKPKLSVIGDISCDIKGGVEVTLKATDPGNPYFTYDVTSDKVHDGFSKSGPVVMAVDNLPSELPRDASIYFSSVLKTLIPDIVSVDFSVPFENLKLASHLRKSVILLNGNLTPEYEYLNQYLAQELHRD